MGPPHAAQDPAPSPSGGSGFGSSRRLLRRLDRRNAFKNIGYNAPNYCQYPPSPQPASAPGSGPTSLAASVACSLDLVNSFRIDGSGDGGGDLRFLCESLGLSGPDDFAIPLADWEAHKAIRSSTSASSSPSSARPNHDSPQRDSPLCQVGAEEPAQAADADPELPAATGRDVPIEAPERPARLDPPPESTFPDARRAAGEGGIKGVRPPPVLKPPPSMALPAVCGVGSTWDILRSFGPDEKEDAPASRSGRRFGHWDAVEKDDDEDGAVLLMLDDLGLEESSEGFTGTSSFGTVYEGISEYMGLNILERIVNESEEPSPLDFALLHSITENFSEKKKIGSGGCGIVYKGILRNGVVAVKRLHSSRTIKDKMFHREVISLISVKHPNIVRFLGYCSFTKEHAIPLGGTIIMADIRERLLCFEYIRNGSLDQHLSDELRGLEWQTRYQIIIGICRGLHYLHKDKEIIHMDLKPGNILLDDLMVPKITDFGLSRPESDSLATTTRLISQGYTAPEYISGGKATSKSDIYSLGVIIIELVTGSRTKPNITKAIRRWNHRWIKSMKQSSLACQQVKKCLELALRCIQDDPTDRPDISDIIDELKEIDATDGQAQIQISSCCLEDILGIEPLEIHIPFEDFKISHSIELTNDTDDYIAFVTKAKLERFCTEPDRGIVPPRSKCSVTLAMQTQVNAQPNVHYTEVITVLSTRVDGALSVDAMDVTSGEIFVDKEGKVVDEVNVMVVFGTPQLAEE